MRINSNSININNKIQRNTSQKKTNDNITNNISSLNKNNKDFLKKSLLLIGFASMVLSVFSFNKLNNSNKNIELIKSLFNSDEDKQILSLIMDKEKLKNITILEKLKIFNNLQTINPIKLKALNNTKLGIDEIYLKLISDLEPILKSQKVENKAEPLVLKKLISSIKNIDKSLLNFDCNKYKDGLPLQYSRKSFINDINELTKDFNDVQKNKIFEHYGFWIFSDNNQIRMSGFPCFKKKPEYLNNEISNSSIKSIEQKIQDFTINNKIKTNNEDINKHLNNITQAIPEFLAIIGQKQHKTHQYSLDIHMIKALKEIVTDSEYSKLTNKHKLLIKFSTLIHDIGKNESEVDKLHPLKSALISLNITKRLNFNENNQAKIYDLIKNHHWIAEYSKTKNMELNFKDSDLVILKKLLAKADLKAVNNYFYFLHYKNYLQSIKALEYKIKDFKT